MPLIGGLQDTISSDFLSQDHSEQRLPMMSTTSVSYSWHRNAAQGSAGDHSNNHLHWKLVFSQTNMLTKTKRLKKKRLCSREQLIIQLFHHFQLWKASHDSWSWQLSKAICPTAPHSSKLKGRKCSHTQVTYTKLLRDEIASSKANHVNYQLCKLLNLCWAKPLLSCPSKSTAGM